MHITIWEYFAGVGVLIAGFLYLLVRKGRKESKRPVKPKREGKLIKLDEYEKMLGGDIAIVDEVQSN